MLFQHRCVAIGIQDVFVGLPRQLVFFLDHFSSLHQSVLRGLGFTEVRHAIRNVVELFFVLSDEHLSRVAELRLILASDFATDRRPNFRTGRGSYFRRLGAFSVNLLAGDFNRSLFLGEGWLSRLDYGLLSLLGLWVFWCEKEIRMRVYQAASAQERWLLRHTQGRSCGTPPSPPSRGRGCRTLSQRTPWRR